MSDQPQIRYLNTDLDLAATLDLTPLTSALETHGFYTLSVTPDDDGLWHARLELETETESKSPEVTISLMLNAIDEVNGKAQELWTQCHEREFNIGYNCGDKPWAYTDGLSNETLQRIARLGASLRITLYPNPPPRDQGQ